MSTRIFGPIGSWIAGLIGIGWVGFTGVAWGACVLDVARNDPAVPVPWIRRVSTGAPSVPPGHLRITFSGHSSFLIETPGGASVITDYNARNLPSVRPDVVTMSNPHDTHSSDVVDPAIPMVLRGWNPVRGVARHDVRMKDARIFSIPTNFIEAGGIHTNVNSIFVVESAGLCAAHLGNLNHVLETETLKKLGRIDVLFVPIDSRWTLNHATAIQVIRQVGPGLVIPMHYDFMFPEEFASLARKSFRVKVLDRGVLLVSRKTLPRATEILFMRDVRLGGP